MDQWSKNHISIKNGIRIPCNLENFVPIVVPGSSRSSSGSSSTLRTPMKQESHCSSSSSSSSSSPTVGEIQVREREDAHARLDKDMWIAVPVCNSKSFVHLMLRDTLCESEFSSPIPLSSFLSTLSDPHQIRWEPHIC